MTATRERGHGKRGHGERPPLHDEYDRQRRRVLWALPTGLYLIGSRHGDAVNLMTANLVVQVCLEPKLVAVAVEAGSVTADLIGRGECIHGVAPGAPGQGRRAPLRQARARRARDATGAVTALSGHEVREVGPARLPVLAAAAGYLVCTVVRQDPLGSHTLFIGEVGEVGGEPAEVLRMEDTRMHYGG